MAGNLGGSTETFTMPRERQARKNFSQEREKNLIELKKKTAAPKVPVVYYISRHGQLEHPHFMEVSLSSHQGLYLKDVINRLDFLRGEGFAGMYSWSSKRGYKNGFVWEDLSEEDLIHRPQGREYILKGSHQLESSKSFRCYDPIFSNSESKNPSETNSSSTDSNAPVIIRRKNQSWSSTENFSHYQVYKEESDGKRADAGTQTNDQARRRGRESEEELEKVHLPLSNSNSTVKVVERSMKNDGSAADLRDRTVGISGRRKASSVLMQLVTCGSILA